MEDNGSDNSREISIVGQSCINLETDSELARLKHYIQSLEATLRRYKIFINLVLNVLMNKM